MKNIWKLLKKPIFALAPMEDVTDTVFRRIVIKHGRPDIMFTEFTNCSGAMSDSAEKVLQRLEYTEEERPLIAQIWGINPEDYLKTAKLIKSKGFDGIDINMGCPVKKIIKKGACSALINNHALASEIINATKEGAKGMPISVKTRTGFDRHVTEDWISFLLSHELSAITVHGRTAKQKSLVPADWNEIRKSVLLRDKISPDTIIIGNGDVLNLEEAHLKVKEYNVDGVMIGRGIFTDIKVFNSQKKFLELTIRDKILAYKEHIEMFERQWGTSKNYNSLKKFAKIYIRDFDSSAYMRSKLMSCSSLEELKNEVNLLIQNL